MNPITIVTGLWDINNDIEKFSKLLKCSNNMCIYVDPSDEAHIWKYRSESNTKIYYKKKEDFKSWFEFYPLIQNIKNIKNCFEQTDDVDYSIMMSKMFLLHDIKIYNPFKSSHFFWIDSTISNKINNGFLDNLLNYGNCINKFIFLSNSHEDNDKNFTKYCNVVSVKYLCSGEIFGGPDNTITEMNNLYYNCLKQILNDKLIETDEYIFTILCHKYSNIIQRFDLNEIDSILSFFEELKECDNTTNKNQNKNNENRELKTNLYVLTYNFPDQFGYLLESFTKSDVNFINKPKKYLINNSTDESTFEKYDILCEKYGFEQIKKNNIGICGGRQFVAEHFDQSDADYYIFFEDDMLLYENNNTFCQNGFRNWVTDLYNKTLDIIHKEKYDFLKMNFTEVYGGNEVQWSWYNVPDHVRHKYFPNKLHKPLSGLDPNPPLTQFTNIKKYKDVTYIEGEIYYCNWPLWFSRDGNRKVFLEPAFAHPFEQTWMSLVFQKQKENLFNVAVLLLSSINHSRICYYENGERREN